MKALQKENHVELVFFVFKVSSAFFSDSLKLGFILIYIAIAIIEGYLRSSLLYL
jgi:hypothetical protein